MILSGIRSILDRSPVCAAVCILLFLLSPPAKADKVLLKIRVGNPIEKRQPQEVKVNLPPGIGTNEIVNLDGLDLGYDMKNDVYYVHKKIDLDAKQILVYNVEFKDIWTIPESTLTELQKHVDSLQAILKNTEHDKTAQELKAEVTRLLGVVGAAQAENSIKSGVKTIQHIRAYEANVAEMDSVKKYVGRLENMALSLGQDPGGILGDPNGSIVKEKRDADLKPQDYKTTVLKITVRNVSPTLKRDTPVRRDLPPEVRANDIIDPDGLEVRADANAGICYVFSNSVSLAAGQTVTYNVKLRDKWNVNFTRFPQLRNSAGNVLVRVKAKGTYKSIEESVEKILADITDVEKEVAPAELNDKYVAFYRHQAQELDRIEQKIARIEDAAMRAIEKAAKLGFSTKAPTLKTTWRVIWIILGFLGSLSLIFYFRWFGRTKAEKATEESPG